MYMLIIFYGLISINCYRILFHAYKFRNVTPMTGGITDGQEHRLIPHARFLEGFLPPRIPVYRVMGMLSPPRFIKVPILNYFFTIITVTTPFPLPAVT